MPDKSGNRYMEKEPSGSIALMQALSQNTTLKSLDLSVNDLRECGEAMGAMLAANRTLTDLKCGANIFFPDNLSLIFDGLKVNQGLKSLDLRGVGITPDNLIGRIENKMAAVNSLAAMLKANSTLQVRQPRLQRHSAPTPPTDWLADVLFFSTRQSLYLGGLNKDGVMLLTAGLAANRGLTCLDVQSFDLDRFEGKACARTLWRPFLMCKVWHHTPRQCPRALLIWKVRCGPAASPDICKAQQRSLALWPLF